MKKEFTKQRDQVIQVNECLMSKEESFVAADKEGWWALTKERLGKRRTVDSCAGLGTTFAGQKRALRTSTAGKTKNRIQHLPVH